MLINLGLVGPKVRPKGVADGQQVNIPVHSNFRPSNSGGNSFLTIEGFDLIWEMTMAKGGASSGATRQDIWSVL